MGMSFKEAASHAKQMKLVFRSFDWLEGTLTAAARAESVQQELEIVNQKLHAENNELVSQVEMLKVTKGELTVNISQERNKAASKADKLWQEAHDTRLSVVEGIKNATKMAAKAAEEAKAKLKADIEALSAERAEAEKELLRVQALVSSLQQKVGGLG